MNLLLAALAAAAPLPPQTGGFDAFSDGRRIHLLAGLRASSGTAASIEYYRSDDGGEIWFGPSPVSASFPAPYRVESGDIQLAAHENELVAVWSSTGPGPMGSGPLVAVRSSDGGQSWRKAASPAGAGHRHGMRFADLASDETGAFHAVWLDRESKAKLLYSKSADFSFSWSEPIILDPDTCECCWNTAAVSSGTVFVLYRNKDPRDMSLSSSKDGGRTWIFGKNPGNFNWHINACPHAGGGLAAGPKGSDPLHALVWTGQDEKAGLHHCVSKDRGKSWSKPKRLGDERSKHGDIAAGQDGRLAAVWDGLSGETRVVYAALSDDHGKNWRPLGVVSSGPGSSPRVAWTVWGFRAFWLEKQNGRSAWRSKALGSL